MRETAGLSFAHKNHIRKLRAAGHTIDEIAALVNCSTDLIQRYLLNTVVEKDSASTTPRAAEDEFQRMLAAKGTRPTAVAADDDRDKFGPLKGTPDWDKLTPGEKSGMTRARKAASLAVPIVKESTEEPYNGDHAPIQPSAE